MWRCSDKAAVWYEWAVEIQTNDTNKILSRSEIHNQMGEA